MQNREEIKSLIEKYIAPDFPEEERGEIGERIDRLVLDPCWLDYIFQTDDYLDRDGKIDYEKFFHKIESYEPIYLGQDKIYDSKVPESDSETE